MTKDFPISLLNAHANLPDEQLILARLQGLLQPETPSDTAQAPDEKAIAQANVDAEPVVEQTEDDSTPYEPESNTPEAEDSSS